LKAVEREREREREASAAEVGCTEEAVETKGVLVGERVSLVGQ
jgi:hypothetical protein